MPSQWSLMVKLQISRRFVSSSKMFPVLSLVTMLPWCRWCEAAACYQYQWVVRDGDVFCQRSDGLRVDSKTVLFHSLINKIMFSISSHNFMGAKRTWGRMEGRMKASVRSTKTPMLKFLIYQLFQFTIHIVDSCTSWGVLLVAAGIAICIHLYLKGKAGKTLK